MRRMSLNFMASLMAIASGYVIAPEALRGAGGAPDIGRSRQGKGQNNKRGKGKISRPRKRSNRQIISKRTRHSHKRKLLAR